jgi:uncharacterized surface protein with fasciclin (FAS1) repeats
VVFLLIKIVDIQKTIHQHNKIVQYTMNALTLLFSLVLIVLTAVEADQAGCESIVDIAVGNDDFSTLVAALTAADLVEALSGDGPFTVFAPTNDAFAKIDEDTLTSLLLPENKSALSNILLYHVLSREVLSTDLEDHTRLLTLQGTTVRVRTDPVVKINRSTVTTADIIACNGVIHVIDTVLIPNKDPPPANANPRIQKVGQCSPSKKCNLCEGDCDSDDDCMDDYVCFKRRKNSFKKVPGCRGGRSDKSGTDYCVDPDKL